MPNSRSLRVSAPAKDDLGPIGASTRRKWGAAQKRKYLGQIRDGFKAIRDTPGLGAPRGIIGKGLRAHPVGKHVIFYRETKNELVIIRVFHETMDPERHLIPLRERAR